MVRISWICLLISQLVFSSSFAQTSSEVKIESTAPAEATAVVPAEAAGTSTAATSSSGRQKKNFNISLFMIGGYSDQQLKNDDPSFDVFDSYVAFNYNINSDVRVSARPAFGYSTSGFNYKGEYVTDKGRIRDFSFAASIKNILEDVLHESLSLRFKPRLYLPTSDGSKDQGMIAALQAETELRYYLSRYNNIKFYVKPKYYFQRTTAFIDSTGRTKTTTMADSEHGVELTWDLSKQFAVKPIVAFEETWSNTSDVNTDRERVQYRKTNMFYGGGVEIRPTRDFSFTVGVRTSKDQIVTDRSEETSYSILTDIDLF